MRGQWVRVLCAAGVVGLALVGCGGRASQRIEEARTALEAARAAGAPQRSPEQFQAAERSVKESEALLAAGDNLSLLEADYRAATAAIGAQSALATAKVQADLEKVQAEAQAIRAHAERLQAQVRAEVGRLEAQVRIAEEVARAAQSRAEQAHTQGLELRLRAAQPPPPAPVSPQPTAIRYVVRPGDTLRRVAARPEIYGSAAQWQRIYDANRKIIGRDRKLKTGQVLTIPKP